MGTPNKPLNSSPNGGGIEENHDKQPVLSGGGSGGTAHGRDEVVVKIDGGTDGNVERPAESKIWRGSSYDFWEDADTAQPHAVRRDDSGFNFQRRSPSQNRPPSPSKMIREFLDRQKASGDVSLDMDLEMEELTTPKILPPIDENSKDPRVSFQSELPNRSDILPNPVRRNRGKGSNANSSSDDDENRDKSRGDRLQQSSGEAIKCSSNKSFQRKSTLLRTKTKSRLMDSTTYPNNERRSGILRSGQVKSGTGNKGEEEEEDPFFDEDLPDEYRKGNFGTFTILQWAGIGVGDSSCGFYF